MMLNKLIATISCLCVGSLVAPIVLANWQPETVTKADIEPGYAEREHNRKKVSIETLQLTDVVRERLPLAVVEQWQNAYLTAKPVSSPEVEARFRREINAKASIKDRAGRIEAAESLLTAAEALEAEGLIAPYRTRIKAIYQFRDLGLGFLSEHLGQIADEAQTHPASADALRILGTQAMLLSGGQTGSEAFAIAINAFERCRQLFETGDLGYQSRAYSDYANSVMHLANLYSLQGDFAAAVETRNAILLHEWVPLSEPEVLSQLLSNAQDLVKLNDAAGAVAHYDAIIRMFPEYGQDDGEIVHLLSARARAFGYRMGSEEFTQKYDEIFQAQAYRKFTLQRASVGNVLATSLARQPDRAVVILHDYATSIEEYLAQDNPLGYSNRQLDDLRLLHADALARLYVAYAWQIPNEELLGQAVEKLQRYYPQHSLLHQELDTSSMNIHIHQ
jgi:hypothetical protein